MYQFEVDTSKGVRNINNVQKQSSETESRRSPERSLDIYSQEAVQVDRAREDVGYAKRSESIELIRVGNNTSSVHYPQRVAAHSTKVDSLGGLRPLLAGNEQLSVVVR